MEKKPNDAIKTEPNPNPETAAASFPDASTTVPSEAAKKEQTADVPQPPVEKAAIEPAIPQAPQSTLKEPELHVPIVRYSHKTHLRSVPPVSPLYRNVEEVGRCEWLIANNPYDTDAWGRLLIDAQKREIAYARTVYERFLYYFPTAGRIWAQYASHEIREKQTTQVEALFKRCLLSVPNTELMRTYIEYTKSRRGPDPRFNDEIIRVYSFAIQHIGTDPMSGFIWMDYITFLTKISQEEVRHHERLKSVFKEVFNIPLFHLEEMMKEFESYENKHNKPSARDTISEKNKIFQATKNYFKELKGIMDLINRSMFAKPLTCDSHDEQQYRVWQNLIALEKENRLSLEQSVLRTRVGFFYNQMIQYFYHYPDVWIDAARFQIQHQGIKEAAKLFDDAIKAIPDSTLIRLIYADFQEQRNMEKETTTIYEELIRDIPSTLAYIQYMRYVRRTKNDNEARKVFMRGKKMPGCTYHLYVAAANIELLVNRKPDKAKNIYEFGMEFFSNDPNYINYYVDYYTRLDEDIGSRAFFEKLLSQKDSNSVEKHVWNRFMEFECERNDLNLIASLENKKTQGLNEPAALTLAHRYQFIDLWPCTDIQLNHIARVCDLRQPSSALKAKEKEESAKSKSFNAAPEDIAMPNLSALIPLRDYDMLNAVRHMLPQALIRFMSKLHPNFVPQGPAIDPLALCTAILEAQIVLPNTLQHISRDEKPVTKATSASDAQRKRDRDDEDDEGVRPNRKPPVRS